MTEINGTDSPVTINSVRPNEIQQKQQQLQDDRLYRYRAKRIRFLINGDKYFQGINYALNTERIRSFDALLNDLTTILSLDHLKLCKGVRNIFDLDGKLITDLTTFQDGHSYLCSSTENFIPTDYRLNNNGMLNWLVRNSACISQSGAHQNGLSSASRKIKAQINSNLSTPNSKNTTQITCNDTDQNGLKTNANSSGVISSRYARGLSSARNSSTPKPTTSHNNVINSNRRNTSTQLSDNQTSSSQHLNNQSRQTPTNSGRASARISRLSNGRASPRPNPTVNSVNNTVNNNHTTNRTGKTPKKTFDTNNSPVSTVTAETTRPNNGTKLHEETNEFPNQANNSIINTRQTRITPSSTNQKPSTKPKQIISTNQSAIKTNNLKQPSTPKSRSPLSQANENIKQDDKIPEAVQERISFGPEVLTRYDIGSPIGDGHFSVVYCCMNKSDQQLCALKLIDKSKCRGNDDMIYNEVKILKKLSHPNIVKLIEEFDYSDELYLILELVQDGDLFDAISAVTKFSEVHVATMIHNLSSALTYLHKHGIVHRDIKPENLLISIQEDGSHSLKLADFGLAVELSKSQPLYSVCGTAFYVSPEMLSEYGYNYKVDVWSTGVICFILLCGYPPFTSTESENNQDELFDAILAGDFQFAPAYWSKISQHSKNLIKCMLEVDPEKRYTAEQVFTDPWTMGTSSNFDGVDPMNVSRRIASLNFQ